MLNKLSPFYAIVLSIPLLKEKPSKFDITATIIASYRSFVYHKADGQWSLFRPLSGFTADSVQDAHMFL